MTDSKAAVAFPAVKDLFARLHLLNRVHNHDDFDLSLDILAKWIKAQGFRGKTRILSYPAGAVYNHWRVPRRWKVLRFSVKDKSGRDIVADKSHPLTLTPFSDSFTGRLTRAELLRHLHSREDLPEAIPFVFRKMYRHWEKGWGIALPHRVVQGLQDDVYDVEIVTEFSAKPMRMLEYTAPGRTPDLIQLAGHLDHPGQCNDGLGGVIASLCAARQLERDFAKTRYGHSVLITPEIVGSAVYLDDQPALAKKIKFALCPNMLYHEAPLALCLSKSGESALDKALRLALLTRGADHVVGPWHRYPDCGDEISYDAPGFGIPTSTLSRVGEKFRHYHTSLDSPALLHQGRFEEAVAVMAEALGYLERDAVPVRTFKGNPCLANPDLNLYLEPVNMSNRFNKAVSLDWRNIETGDIIDPRNFMEFVLSNLEGNAHLLDLAYEARVPFASVADYVGRFGDKNLVRFRPGPAKGKVVKVALGVSETAPLDAAQKEAAPRS